MPQSDSELYYKKKKKPSEILYSVHSNNKNNTLRAGDGHSHGNEMCFNTDPLLGVVGKHILWLQSKGGVATGHQLVAPACLCVLQLGCSQVLNGQAGLTKSGKIAASFIDNTIYKQRYSLLRVLFVRVIFSKSWAHGPTYRELCLQATQ